jgi:hypothetical protein
MPITILFEDELSVLGTGASRLWLFAQIKTKGLTFLKSNLLNSKPRKKKTI